MSWQKYLKWTTTAGLAIAATTSSIGQAVATTTFNGSSYARNVSLAPDVDIFWTIDTELETIRVAVHTKTSSGWAGVGVSEMGGMEGADIVFYEAAVRNEAYKKCVEFSSDIT